MSTSILIRQPVSEPINAPSARLLLIAWLLAGVLLCVGLASAPVRRTQEARVLETARQMVQPQFDARPALQRWLAPSLNGELRLKKPPLACWMSAISYEIGGVGTFTGRLPTVICGWLALLVTFSCGRWLMGTRGGAISALCLFSSYMFYSHDRLAETDGPAMLFCTLAIYAWWRAIAGNEVQSRDSDDFPSRSIARGSLWYVVGAIATALAIMAKGGPGAFPPIFLIAMILIYRRWDALRGFVFSGAPVVLVLLAAPWFLYVQHMIHSDQLGTELEVLIGGEDHAGPPTVYFAQLMMATFPWCGFMIAALVVGVVRIARNINSRVPAGLVIWVSAILVPLCCVGNKQPHYLLPALPPLMLLVGWWLETTFFQVSDGDSGESATKPLIGATMFATLALIPAVLIGAKKIAHHIHPIDVGMAIGITAGFVIVAIVYRRRGWRAGFVSYLLATCMMVPMLLGIWTPRLEPDDSRLLARQVIAQFGNGPYANWGRSFSLPLCFALRQTVPDVHAVQELRTLTARAPGLVLIVKSTPKLPTPPPPAPFVEAARFRAGSQPFVFYTRDPALDAKMQTEPAH